MKATSEQITYNPNLIFEVAAFLNLRQGLGKCEQPHRLTSKVHYDGAVADVGAKLDPNSLAINWINPRSKYFYQVIVGHPSEGNSKNVDAYFLARENSFIPNIRSFMEGEITSKKLRNHYTLMEQLMKHSLLINYFDLEAHFLGEHFGHSFVFRVPAYSGSGAPPDQFEEYYNELIGFCDRVHSHPNLTKKLYNLICKGADLAERISRKKEDDSNKTP
ncbi:MAG: hypothetical protein ABIE22_02430 [archaeon]